MQLAEKKFFETSRVQAWRMEEKMKNIFEEAAKRYTGSNRVATVKKSETGLQVSVNGVTAVLQPAEKEKTIQELCRKGKLLAIQTLSDSGITQSRGLGFYQHSVGVHVYWVDETQSLVAEERDCDYCNGQVYDEYTYYMQ